MDKIFPFLVSLLLLASCGNISEDDRLIYVKPADVSKAVLIEDFTGQRCINCPNAAEEIEKLQKQYGKENVVAISIHSGPLAVYSNSRITGLRTQLGDDYYDYWKVEAEPTALINRKGGVVNLDKWQTAVYQELQTLSTVQLDISTHTDTVNNEAVITVTAQVNEPFKGKLQLWLLEDNIVAPQMMPDGTMNMEYVHQHVLRFAINDGWGNDVDWQQGEQIMSFTSSLDKAWRKGNLSVVAFVYNTDGVMQVKCVELK